MTTIEFKHTKNYLEQLVKKVESLLGLLLICHKYETLHEKVCSYTDYREIDSENISTIYECPGNAEVR